MSAKKGLDKYADSENSLIMVFPVCYSDKHFVNSSSDNFICEQKERSARNYRILGKNADIIHLKGLI